MRALQGIFNSLVSLSGSSLLVALASLVLVRPIDHLCAPERLDLLGEPVLLARLEAPEADGRHECVLAA